MSGPRPSRRIVPNPLQYFFFRNIEFSMGWFADPIHFGRYPVSMTERVGFLPVFTEADKERLIKSIDFFGSGDLIHLEFTLSF